MLKLLIFICDFHNCLSAEYLNLLQIHETKKPILNASSGIEEQLFDEDPLTSTEPSVVGVGLFCFA